MAKAAYYLLVNTSTEGMALYRALREHGCRVRVAPVPRGVTACCGTSVMVEPEDMPAVQAVLDADSSLAYERVVKLEGAIDPQRDVFC